ncbi:reverse transcriptase domain-containing protein [Artemisia annua]|uniref:Reverse transcriptase domain-containing protein n=1 Tax=Artemisia annua TaxID=35608 RepID=A0A2U1KG22_ARTAN|nr:reverse transcriptase domain-containing protein [Artemisia annua]
MSNSRAYWLLYTPSCDVQDGLFPRGIGRPALGAKLLGDAVSKDVWFISSLAVKRASRAVELMSEKAVTVGKTHGTLPIEEEVGDHLVKGKKSTGNIVVAGSRNVTSKSK